MPNPAYSTPYIENITPENGSVNVDVGTSIIVVFSDDIDKSTIHSKYITLYGDTQSVSCALDYNSTDRVLTITPYDELLGDSKYTLRIDSNLSNISGDSLDKDFVASFTTTDTDLLDSPKIVSPLNQSIINTPKIVWERTELAEAYHVEIAEDADFNKLVYSNNLINDYQIIIASNEKNVGITVDKLNYDREYFLRVRALDVVYDTANVEITIGSSDIYYYEDSERKAIVDSKYWPLEKINSLTVYDEYNNPINISPEKITIESSSTSFIFDAGDINIQSISADIDYGIKKDNSSWSDTVSFYYEQSTSETTDYKDLILSSLDDSRAGDVEVTLPESLVNVDLDINEIRFKVYGVESIENISAKLRGYSINDIPYIASHGDVEGTLSLVETETDYLLVAYTIPTLLENNEYQLLIDVNGRESKIDFISKINPALTTIKIIKNSSIGSFLEVLEDKKILFSIYDSSVIAVDIAESADNSIDLKNPSLAAVKYTTFKTQLDLLYAVYLSKTSAKSTTLGDFSVDSFKFSEISPVLDDLRKRVDYWESVLKGDTSEFAQPLSVSKSEGTYRLGDRTF